MSSSFAAKAAFVLLASFALTTLSLTIQITVSKQLQLSRMRQCGAQQLFTGSPPMADRRPLGAGEQGEAAAADANDGHNQVRREHLSDPYTWLRDDKRADPAVLSYLKAENTYAAQYLEPLQGLVDDLVDNMDSRVADVEVSSPSLRDGYVTYDVRGPGDDYWTTYRQPLLPHLRAGAVAGSSNGSNGLNSLAHAVAAVMLAAQQGQAPDSSNDGGSSGVQGQQCVFDQNRLSSGHTYWDVVSHVVSPDGRLVAFLVDTVGDEVFTLQVLEVSSGQALLPAGVPGCGEVLLWWGARSDTLVYSTVGGSGPGSSGTQLHLLRLMSHPGGEMSHQGVGQQQALLYAPSEGERGVDLQVTADRCFLLLTSTSADGSTNLLALPASTPLELNTNQSSSTNTNNSTTNDTTNNSSSSGPSLAVPASSWWQLLQPQWELEIMSIEHLGASGSSGSNGSCADSNAANGSSSSSDGSRFVALVDSDDAPDGEVVVIHAGPPPHGSSSSSSNNSTSGPRLPRMEILISNYTTGGGSSSSAWSRSGSSSGYASDEDSSSYYSSEGPPSSPQQQQQQQQQQQSPPAAGSSGVPPLEVRDFKLTPDGTALAVAVRRAGVCAVDVYTVDQQPATAAAATTTGTQAAPQAAAAEVDANDSQQQQQQQQQSAVRVVPLRTQQPQDSSSSSTVGGGAGGTRSNSSTAAAAAAVAAAAAAATAATAATSRQGSARLSWVLVLQEPTLVLDLLGVMSHDDVMTGSGLSRENQPAEDSWLAVRVSGITSPTAVYYINLKDPEVQVKVYQEQVPGFDPATYTSTLEWAVSADGTRVPLTLAYRTDDVKGDGRNAAVLHAYGAYGSSQWPSFNPADLAMLDRGVVLGICHVRGGGELGSRWHTAATKQHKKRTFEDLLACADHLVASRYCSADRLGLWGRSAGGLTLGAAINMRPAVSSVAVLDVPFLDVLGDMSDPGLPLTVKERKEWGDPLASRAVHDYIASYSPLHNLDPQAGASYPAMLLTASLHDTRVNFWEPAKYVATLRYIQQQQQQQQQPNNNTGSEAGGQGVATQGRPLLLLTDLDAGHFAASGASSRLQERAVKVAFLLHNLRVC